MRATPMAVYTSLLDEESACEAIVAEVMFTHSNQTVQDAIVLYDQAIHYLLKNPNQPDRALIAFQQATESAKSKSFY